MSDSSGAPRNSEVDFDPFAGPALARVVPTTEAQREIWLAVQLGPEASMAYNESVTLRLQGDLNVASLQSALRALSDRHEALRTTISEDGQSMLVAAHGDLQAALLDIRARDVAEQAAVRAEICKLAVETPFDLGRGPLIRAQLLSLKPDLHELVITGHHIVCDGWSFGVLSRDLMTLYEAILSNGDATTLPQAESFADYAIAQLDESHAATAEADLQYWLGCFRSAAPALELPNDRARPAVRSFDSLREDLPLDAGLVRAVKAAGAKCGASLFVTLFTSFAALMARLSRSEDLVVGISAAGQSAENQHQLVGHCVNLLPVRLTVDVNQPMSRLLEQVRSAVLDAYDHQSCTFGSLLKRLTLPRDASRPALVSVVFNLDTAITSRELSRSGLLVSLQSNPRHFENFEAFLNASETEDGVLLELQYNTALFDAATVRRWLTLYRQALQRLVAQPDAIVVDMLAPDAADVALLGHFNGTAKDYEKDLRLGDLLLRGMRQRPNDDAVRFEGRSVSFAQLEGMAWAVAAQLRQRGAASGTLVGVCLERSVEMVAALVGVIFAGAAYVPLDPTLPPERLRQMADDANLRLVLTRQSELARAAQGFPADCVAVLLDALEPQSAGQISGTANDPAYVIFTSGSTGRPKGAMNAHRGIVNRLLWMQDAYRLQNGDSVMQKTPFSFDVSVWEFFWPLMTGATIVVARPEGHRDGGYLIDLIRRERITVMHFVPSMLRLFLAEAAAGDCRSLRQVICSGEALPADLVGRFFSALPAVKLANLYGPTEAAVDVTAWDCDPQDRSGVVPIGRPIANTSMYVLDERMRPLPLGVPGDLYIGGVQVGMGYVARPGLTAERFIADPFSAGGRLYKTGDVAAWRADGALIYFGRSDFQVKLRGYRIELGEIEAQLQRDAGVSAATVVTWSDGTGDMRLVAYVVPQKGVPLDAQALRETLRQKLPDYMVPQHFVALAAMPLLSSGKVDRRALPPPAFEVAAAGTRVAPETPIEAAVLAAMEEILKLPGLGTTDDFFALGGHSLLAARLTTRLNREFNLSLPMRTVFESPTARALAEAVATAQRSGTGASVNRIARQMDQERAPLTVMQERIRFMESLHPGRVVYNTPSAHRLTGPMDVEAFKRAFADVVARQPSLRTVIETHGEQAVQRVLSKLHTEIPFEDLSALAPAQREVEMLRAIQAITDVPIDIQVAPLFRTALYRMAENEHVFFFMPHHIIWDGWSFDLLYQEMAAAYEAILESRPSTLPLPPVTYADFAHWHAQWLQSDAYAAQLKFWKHRFASIDTPGAIPTDRPRKAGMSGVGAAEWVHIDKALTERLRKVAKDADSTLNMLTMAVYCALLTEVVAGRSIVLGVPVRGRLVSEIENVMGFFNNLLPAYFRVELEMPMADWMRTVKRELLDMFSNQEVPFERLASEPELARHSQRSGLYQSLFSFQDARERQRSWGPLQHSSVLVMQKGATEDFGLWLMEVPGGLEGGVNFNADLFERGTAEIFRKRFVALLGRLADNPALTVAQLLALPGEDTAQFAQWIAKRGADVADNRATDNIASEALTPEQQALAEIWAALLGIDAQQILASDNFFDLGGNSLLVMRAIADGERVSGVKIDPRRYVYESLQQLSVMSATNSAGVGAASEPAKGGISGFLRRVVKRK